MPLIVDKAGKEPKDTLMLTPRTDLTVTPPTPVVGRSPPTPAGSAESPGAPRREAGAELSVPSLCFPNLPTSQGCGQGGPG